MKLFSTSTQLFAIAAATALFISCSDEKATSKQEEEINVEPLVAVDLGLKVKWASKNLGAQNPQEFGDYYAWGEIEPYYAEGHSRDRECKDWREGKSGYDWASYRWSEDSFDKLTKYNTKSTYGKVDNILQLQRGLNDGETNDDVSSVVLGESWRIPTKEDWEELMTKCKWEWKQSNKDKEYSHSGYLVTAENGNSIFLPAAGKWEGTTGVPASPASGSYWSSTLSSETPCWAWWLNFLKSNVAGYYSGGVRANGLSVRPVSD